MDGTQFDRLIKQLATTRLTRLHAVRGLAVSSIVALTGVTPGPEPEAGANGKQGKKGS